MYSVGRPKKKKEAKGVTVCVRMTESDVRVLDELCRELGVQRSEVIRRGVGIQSKMLEYAE